MDAIIVIWTNLAITQRNKIFEYWNKRNRSNSYSKRINLIIYEKIDLLESNPLIGEEIEDYNARIIHFENYGLVYKIEKHNIYILSFWDSKQNPKKILEILKK
ncbi:type II toxin-antitoxin system RelE/ParE family toxin [Kaistella flava (ex Peng et al. 2021)]|uniref:Type II toxin-antitoxin system RelE/ParE family toxin n=1 Tax=Kaistella flava (ex Peng et al. 2021) TaxID=2038776 RepID=A0A7M2Y758_9FLAO|nr:type II toxin-antitoxin system RelE/ParE family toxin [Kaistella flava (ex Peng et al. 2021)]QOW09649.1 type II toxin-antitoxin system RelE/ParE family toxin [Kaistella flava (ex Peng et al. 2021)]